MNHSTECTRGAVIRGDFLQEGTEPEIPPEIQGEKQEVLPRALLCGPEASTGQGLQKSSSLTEIILNISRDFQLTASSSPPFWILMLLSRMGKFLLKVGWKYPGEGFVQQEPEAGNSSFPACFSRQQTHRIFTDPPPLFQSFWELLHNLLFPSVSARRIHHSQALFFHTPQKLQVSLQTLHVILIKSYTEMGIKCFVYS